MRTIEKQYPETFEELIEECKALSQYYDLYTLGEYGIPFTGEKEPRVIGTEVRGGEFSYGVAMVPAQWILKVIELSVTENISGESNIFNCKKCNFSINYNSIDYGNFKYCPNCRSFIKKN